MFLNQNTHVLKVLVTSWYSKDQWFVQSELFESIEKPSALLIQMYVCYFDTYRYCGCMFNASVRLKYLRWRSYSGRYILHGMKARSIKVDGLATEFFIVFAIWQVTINLNCKATRSAKGTSISTPCVNLNISFICDVVFGSWRHWPKVSIKVQNWTLKLCCIASENVHR